MKGILQLHREDLLATSLILSKLLTDADIILKMVRLSKKDMRS